MLQQCEDVSKFTVKDDAVNSDVFQVSQASDTSLQLLAVQGAVVLSKLGNVIATGWKFASIGGDGSKDYHKYSNPTNSLLYA